jgi:hypothetical protein
LKTLACYIPSQYDATSLYRARGPLETLARRMGGNLRLQINPDASWASMKSCDAIFMQRCHLDHHQQIVDLAVDHRKPVWADYDDDLFTVPPSNPTYPIYGNPKIQANVTGILAKCDVLSVSTHMLAAKFGAILKSFAGIDHKIRGAKLDPTKIVVVPNAYDTEILEPITMLTKRPEPRKMVVWRGSGTHDKDLMTFTAPMAEVIASHLDWNFNFVGSPFWWTIEQLGAIPGIKPNTITVAPPIDPIQFFIFLREVRPALMIVPLDDCPFNRAKSNIAWVEATHAGAVTLAPDWEEWRRPGIINYKDRADFGRLMGEFLDGKIDADAHWFQSRDFIVQNLTLTKVNHLRELILRNLVDPA